MFTGARVAGFISRVSVAAIVVATAVGVMVPTVAGAAPKASRSLGPVTGSLAAHHGLKAAAGTLPPNNPPTSIPPSPDIYAACSLPFDSSSACSVATVAAINHARSLEGVGEIHLPTNYNQLDRPTQFFVVLNIERIDRGLAPILGMTAELNNIANTGAVGHTSPTISTDPNYPPATDSAGELAYVYPNPLTVDYGLMYLDGTNGDNASCTTASSPACWVHRDLSLVTYGYTATMGAAAVLTSLNGSTVATYGMIFVDDNRPVTHNWSFTWAQELPFWAGAPSVSNVSGNTGPASGGAAVTITGTSLLEVTEVDFGANRAGRSLTIDPFGHNLTVTAPGTSTIGATPITMKSYGGTVNAGSYNYTLSVPAPPAAVFAASVGSGKILVSWTSGPTGGSSITGYTVSVVGSPSGPVPANVGGSTRTATLTGFTPGTGYKLQVSATNAQGPGGETQTGTITAAALTAPQKFVFAAYADFLNRDPLAQELNFDATALGAHSLTQGAVVSGLASSPEWISAIIQKLYQDTLGRAGDAGGVAFWVNQIRTGVKTVAQAAANFYASPEYFNNIGGGTNQSWIADLYTKLLLRTADASGSSYWVGQTVQNGRVSVAFRFYQSTEAAQTRVKNLYQKLLGRAPDSGGLNYWAGQVIKTGDIALAANLASSTEYYQRAQTRFPG